MRCTTFMISCPERGAIRKRTLASLASSDWTDIPTLILDESTGEPSLARIQHNWRRALAQAARATTELVLLLEDDLVFCRHLARNLFSWPILHGQHPGRALYGSLYDPGHSFLRKSDTERYRAIHPCAMWGSQAIVMTPQTARFIDQNWDSGKENCDLRMPRLVSSITTIYAHVPSLVEHADAPTTWGGFTHRALEFDPEWLAPSAADNDEPTKVEVASQLPRTRKPLR
ncbi:MAG: hypothetical protein QM784_37195 [Polyangiaceae bacterium]